MGKISGNTIGVHQDPKQLRTSRRIIDPSTQDNNTATFRTDSSGNDTTYDVNVVEIPGNYYEGDVSSYDASLM